MYLWSCGSLSHPCFFPGFRTKPPHNPSAAQPDMWNRSHSTQVNIKTVHVKITANAVVVMFTSSDDYSDKR